MPSGYYSQARMPMPRDTMPGMSILRLHAVGDWRPEGVLTSWVHSTHALPREAVEQVDHAWREATARPGVKLFDGPMCRLEAWAVRGGDLELALAPTSYKQFLGTNMRHPEWADRFGPAALANPVGVSAALETADGFLLLGRRNATLAYYPGRVHPFAGSMDPADGGRRAPDPFAAIRRELSEELSLAPTDLADVRCTGIVEDTSLRQPELIFRVKTKCPRAEVEARVDRDEHHASVAVAAWEEGMTKFLSDPLLTPVGVASLLLWGRVAFGGEWFERQRPTWERVPQAGR